MKPLPQQREGHPDGYYEATINGVKYSVVNFGKTMSTAPNWYGMAESGVFMGWEAIPIRGGKLASEEIYRADSWEKLWNKINNI